MARTYFDPAHHDFSNAAHDQAQRLIYPHLFPQQRYRPEWLSFETTNLNKGGMAVILDAEMATDRIVRVHGYDYMNPFCFSVQERFRDPRFLRSHGPELTITEWNNASGLPSELYKLYAGIFVYGYFDAQQNAFPAWIAVNTCAMMLALLADNLKGISSAQNNKRQDFIAIPFASLAQVDGVVIAMGLGEQVTR